MIVKDTEPVDVPKPIGPMRTYLFRPATEGRYPGLLLFSEIFQVTGPIRRAAAMLASYGFVVARPVPATIRLWPGSVTTWCWSCSHAD
jgi:carboxymethylenebutenolidase